MNTNIKSAHDRFSRLVTCASLLCFLAAVLIGLTFYLQETDYFKQKETFQPAFHIGEKDVLVLGSYDVGYFSFDSQKRGIHDFLEKNNVHTDYIFLDARTDTSEAHFRHLHDELLYRMRRQKKYDAILVADDPALQFALRYQKEFFNEIPMVYYGVSNRELAARASRDPWIAGYIEDTDLKGTISLAHALMPKADKVVMINDRSVTSLQQHKKYLALMQEFPQLALSELNTVKYSRDALGEKIRHIDSDTILLFVDGRTDENGNEYSMAETVQYITRHAHVPIFCVSEQVLGTGFLGGSVIGAEKRSAEASKLLLDVLKGNVAIQETDNLLETRPEYFADVSVLDRYHLDRGKLPAGTHLLNDRRAEILWELKLVSPALFVILGLIGLLSVSRRLSVSRKYASEHDHLTHLYNRHTALAEIRKKYPKGKPYSVILVTVDELKEWNDFYGHEFGNNLLCSIAGKLETYAGKNHFLTARNSEDEFLVFIPKAELTLSDPEVVEIERLCREPHPFGSGFISLPVSIGVANYDGISNPALLTLQAEIAVHNAKQHGESNVSAIFTEEMKKEADEKVIIKTVLQKAIESDGFYMVYQPKISVKDRKTAGFEALVRIRGHQFSPERFIAIAEQNGWLRRIGRITTELVIRQQAKWKAEGHRILPVSINYSGIQLQDKDYFRFLMDTLAKYQVPPSALHIEITERVVIKQTQQALEQLQKFHEAGILLEMDDFGSGYSSLSCLSYLPFDIIKVDKSVVSSFLTDPKRMVVMQDIITLGHDMKVQMICEGVETKEQYEKLREMGADLIQGYYFSRPLPPDKAIAFQPE